MRTPCRARTTPSSTSGTSVMQTGQPGPMMTFSVRGSVARSPNLAIACSWLPHTSMIDTGDRPISATTCVSASVSDRARSGSRNFSCATPPLSRVINGSIDLAAHIGGHQIVFLRCVTKELFIERQRRLNLRRGNAADRVADVIEDVVAGHDGLVDH